MKPSLFPRIEHPIKLFNNEIMVFVFQQSFKHLKSQREKIQKNLTSHSNFQLCKQCKH
jgi:hypothetical protein